MVKFLRANGFKPHELLKLPIEELERMKQIVEVSDLTEKDFLLIEAKKALKISLPFLDQFGTGFGKSEVMNLSNEFKEWIRSDRHEL